MTEVKMYMWDSAFVTLSLIEPDARTTKRFNSDDPQENKSELSLVWMLTTGLHEISGSQRSQLKKKNRRALAREARQRSTMGKKIK